MTPPLWLGPGVTGNDNIRLGLVKNGAAQAPSKIECRTRQAENDEPQPQVVVAFGFLITNCAPSRPSV